MVEKLIANRYRAVELLGKGGMGEVHRVVDTRCAREVALKRLFVSDAGKCKIELELFEREYHALSELAHPRIIEVYDYGVDAEGAYYTMELLTGKDLRQVGRLPWEEVCGLLRDLASSLAIIHSRRLIHADLSPHNVRCTADGRAKLLDFGAMMSMGAARHIVGTPPFVAPETVYGAALDGRTDIYGLGALGYWLLTARHAYPARDFAQLIVRWDVPVQAPHDLCADVPVALSNLIMDCLQLDQGARPRTAGVVMERLCTLASLPLEEQDDVAVAYLTTPTLLGRSDELALVRQKFADMKSGRGAVLVVEGPAGSGRSRFSRACAMEATRLGRHVVQVAAGDGAAMSYGAARSVCTQLFALAPEASRRAARAGGAALAYALDPDPAHAGAKASPGRPAHAHVLIALRDFVAAAARGLELVVVVDDADRIDVESVGLLVSMAQRAERRALCMVLTVDSNGLGSTALDLLRNDATVVPLSPLSEQQTEELVRCVFGDVSHIVSLARKLHSIAAGSPRAVLQLATHLVEHGIVRYEAGAFLLPELLHERDLPASLGEALGRRLDALDADALELGCALALTDPRELPTASYPELTAHGHRGKTFRAIDQLVRAELLVREGERYRLGDGIWRTLVEARLPAERKRELHARLARLFEPAGAVNRRALHLMRGGDPEGAIRVLLAQYIKDPNEPRDPLEDYVPGILDLLEEIVHASENLDIPVGLKVELRMKTLGASQFVGEVDRFLRLAPPLLAQLKRDSGLADYEALGALDPSERLPEAFRLTQERYAAAPERERGMPLFDAMREVSRLCVMHSGVTAFSLDGTLLDRLPDLTPLAALSPAIAAISLMIASMRLVSQGRSLKAREGFLTLLERLGQPDGAGLGELYNRSLRLGAVYIVGLIEAALGRASAGGRATELEREPGHRVNAQRVHMTMHLMRGDVQEAAVAQRRTELLMLQDGQHVRYPGSSIRSELQVAAVLEDLTGLKEVTERLTKAAVSYPKWGVYADVGRCHLRRAQGDSPGALKALEPALAAAAPLVHRDWPSVAAAHVQVLVDLGRTAEAVECGREYLATCRNLELLPGAWNVAHALAAALLSSGDVAESARLLDDVIEEATRYDVRGLFLGTFYELRARAALAERNQEDFERFLALCKDEYRPESVAALAIKFQRLVRDAQRSGVVRENTPLQAHIEDGIITAANLVTTAHSRLAECEDAQMRAECVLKILAEQMGVPLAAFLYGVSDGHVDFLGAAPRSAPHETISGLARGFLLEQLELSDVHTMTTAATLPANLDDVTLRFSLAPGSSGQKLIRFGSSFIQPVALTCVADGELRLAGIAMLEVAQALPLPPVRLIEMLGAAMLEGLSPTAIAHRA
ncbi:MAG TPA: protein kinase [Polyangiaceae bacterium]|nr:protein kinase [Polyangiaceae bacterium]